MQFDRDKNGYLNAEELNSFNLHIGFDEFSAADFANLCTSLADDASPEQVVITVAVVFCCVSSLLCRALM